MNSLRRQKYAILLTALIGVALVESFSHRLLLGPVASELVISMTRAACFPDRFRWRLSRLIAFIALAIALAVDWAHYVATAELPPGIAPFDLSQCAASVSGLRGNRHPAEHL